MGSRSAERVLIKCDMGSITLRIQLAQMRMDVMGPNFGSTRAFAINRLKTFANVGDSSELQPQ